MCPSVSCIPSQGTYICPVSCTELLDGIGDSGQGLPAGQVEEAEGVVKGRECLKSKTFEKSQGA